MSAPTRWLNPAWLLLLLALPWLANAHEVRPAYLEITESPSGRVHILWKQPTAGRLSLPLSPRLSSGWLDEAAASSVFTNPICSAAGKSRRRRARWMARPSPSTASTGPSPMSWYASCLNINKGPHWRRLIQSKLYARITYGSGARHFTPFFIRPAKGHGDFWLLHLSQHSKARDVMAATHWKHNNHFVHYGQAGLDMFGVGYAAILDEDNDPQTAFEFDDLAATQSHSSMLEEIPRLLDKKREGVLFGDFFMNRCNSTPATRAMVEDAALELVREKGLEVAGLNDKKRNVRTAIRDDDIIRLPAQSSIVFFRK